MAQYKSRFTGQEIDAGIVKAGEALKANDNVSSLNNDAGYLTEHQSLKTINGQSIVGTGNIVIEGGSGTSDYSDLTNKPSINNVQLSGNKSSADLGVQPAGDYATRSELPNVDNFITKDVNNLTNYYTKTEVDGKVSSVYKYKGSVSTYGDLPSTDLNVGDVYNIATADKSHHIKAGDNVAWNGSAWDVLAGDIDLTDYYDKTEVDGLLSNKQNTLVSGTNIKTINGMSVLGSGNLDVAGGSGLTQDIKLALLACLQNVAYTSAEGRQSYDELEELLVPVLPSEYQRVEYIASDGNAYFSLSSPYPVGYTYITKVYQTQRDSSTGRVPLGGLCTSGTRLGTVCYSASENYIGTFYGTNNCFVSTSSIYNEPVELTITNTASSMSFTCKTEADEFSKTITPASTITDYADFGIFWDDRAANAFIGRMYSLKVMNGTNLVANFIPCYRIADNAVGLYEKVAGVFYTSDTATPFTKGGDI